MPTPANRHETSSATAINTATAHPKQAVSVHEEEHGSIETSDLILIGIAALAALLRLFPVPGYFWIAACAVLGCGFPIYREALNSLRECRMTMELSMTIALVAAMTIGESFTALMIVLFVLIAEAIEGLTIGRGRRAIKDLLDLLPRSVEIRGIAAEETIRLSDLPPGSVIIVRPGRKPGTVSKLFSTDPPSDDRIAHSQEIIQKYLKQKPEYVLSTSEFNDVKTRVPAMHNRRKVDDAKDAGRPTLRRNPNGQIDSNGDEKAPKSDQDDRSYFETTGKLTRHRQWTRISGLKRPRSSDSDILSHRCQTDSACTPRYL